jgi:hypothetical protein
MLSERAVEFPSEGAMLRGLLIRDSTLSSSPAPLVIMAHGTSATLKMVAIEYARALAQAGLCALIYDHRNLGQSGGTPRGEINPWIQCRGYLDAMSFSQSLPEIDPRRLALWGDSFAGGEALVVAACDERVKAVVAQSPSLGAEFPSISPSVEVFSQIKKTLLSGDVTGTPETTTGPMPVVSFDQDSTPSLLGPIQAFRWFIDMGGRPGSGWVNRVTRVIPPTPVIYNACLCAPFVKARTLMIVSPEDEMPGANPAVVRMAFDLIPAPKEWHDIADGHFGLLYHPGPRFDEAVAVQVRFLVDALRRFP